MASFFRCNAVRSVCAGGRSILLVWFLLSALVRSVRAGDSLAVAQPECDEHTSAADVEGNWNFEAWKLDRVLLRSGKKLDGLIERETAEQIRLLEIRRPAGRGLFGVSQQLKRSEIAEIRTISPKERAESLKRFHNYINRGRVETVEREGLRLEEFQEGNAKGWRYRGEWFTLESRAPEEITRRFVVRLEQIFTAFRRLLPPRMTKSSELRIVLFGTSADYQALARSLGAPLANAALYHSERNLVAAGSDLAKLAGQLAQAQAHHAALRADLQTQRANLANLAKADERIRLQKQIDDTARQATILDRQNELTFKQHAGRVMAVLHHEAFHAYLENYVYPRAEYDVPRWLNEGLAQIFENGTLEAYALRVDEVNRSALMLIAADLSRQPTPLAEVLTADHRSFLTVHDGDRSKQLNYAYAWALAHYLMFVKPVLGGPAMDEYVAKSPTPEPLARFEQLVQQPLPEFEATWRQWVLQKAGKR